MKRVFVSAVPSLDRFLGIEDNGIPGSIIFGSLDKIVLNPGRKAVILKVVNTGDRPVQVSSGCLLFLTSFFHDILFIECNISNFCILIIVCDH